MRTLDQLRPGMSARVVRLAARGAIGQRLSDMGFVEGTAVKLIRAAPLGDPLEVEIQDYLLSLRRAEAHLVEISDA
ncbi:MAG TPA: ferrous iron transport protein A [Planctomycetota bacterium]|jgi:Fe2+ transport system protein FeoA|nr:ferrous iron transport protein A [Planctomycetota bacterium]